MRARDAGRAGARPQRADRDAGPREAQAPASPRGEHGIPRPASRIAAVAVRQATLADLDVVVELRIALLKEHGDNPVYSRLRPDAAERARPMFAQQLQSRDEAIYLAERDGLALGILRCVDAIGSPLLYPARYAYVSSVYVVPPARRGGVLRALMDSAVRWCESRGLREMRLHNASDNPLAAGAWQAMGFEVVEHLRVKTL